MDSSQFKERHRVSPKHFVRVRPGGLPFGTVVRVLLNLCKNSIKDELEGFFQTLLSSVGPVKTATKGAFSRARYKLKASAFVEVNHKIVRRFYNRKRYYKWEGTFRLLAVDGSTARVPVNDETRAHFGGQQTKKRGLRPLARVSQLYDVLNQITVDAGIGPYSTGELDMAMSHLEHCGKNDLILFDRGYPAFWLFALLAQKGIACCARAAVNFCPQIAAFLSSGRKDAYIMLTPGRSARRKARKRGLPTDPIKLRLLRVELASGEVEVLITSLLDRERFPRSSFADLYALRWGVEERYKAIKSRLQVENFMGLYPPAVMQEFHAKIATANLTSLHVWHAQRVVWKRTEHRRYEYKVNFTNALSKMKNAVVHLLSGGATPELLAALLENMVTDPEPVRPGRKYPRRAGPKLQGYYMSYKPTR